MKHISKSLKGTVTTTVEGNETTMPLTHSLYRMSLKLVLKEDAEYECDQAGCDAGNGEGHRLAAAPRPFMAGVMHQPR